MELIIYEYNVTPKIDEKNEFSVRLINDSLTINGNNVEDESKVYTIKKASEENKEKIIELASEKTSNYKGGRQKNLTVKFENDGETYRIIGNTPSNEMASLYTKIVNDIIKTQEEIK